MTEIELAVIGAGPAGMAAALEAKKHGVATIVLDENPRPGGEIYRQRADSLNVTAEAEPDKEHVAGEKLIEQLRRAGIEVQNDTSVWSVSPAREICFTRQGKSDILKAAKLVLAEGAYDRPLPFPGWTLPGVITAGGTLRLVKSEKVLPGRNVLLSGSGPLQLALADQLSRAGARVVAVLEASSYGRLFLHAPRLLGQRQLVRDGLGYYSRLRRQGIPLLTRHAIIAARGKDAVQEAVYARLDAQGKPVPGSEKAVAVDTVCLGYGLTPSTRLARLRGCTLHFDAKQGGWLPQHDENMQTSVADVYVAGDGAGIGGVFVALAEGRLAGLSVARQLGRATDDEVARQDLDLRRTLRGLRSFESALNDLFAIGSGLYERITDGTIICRCEEITAGEIRASIANGQVSINGIKSATRAGMGHCQGRNCELVIAEMVARQTGRTVAAAGYATPRQPIKPVPLHAFLTD